MGALCASVEEDVVFHQHRHGSQDEGAEEVEVDVVPGAVELPAQMVTDTKHTSDVKKISLVRQKREFKFFNWKFPNILIANFNVGCRSFYSNILFLYFYSFI